MPTRSPTLAEVLDTWRDGIMRDTRVSFPAQVTRYDSVTQLCDVKPLIQDHFEDEDDSFTSISLPIITNVPVCWPRGGGFAMTMPLAVGDTVGVLVQDRSIDQWLEQGGEQSPTDERRHALKDAIAIPGLHDKTKPVPSVPTTGMMFGKDAGPRVKVTASDIQLGGTDETVACAGKVATELNRIWTAFQAHVHTVSVANVQSGSSTLAATVGAAGGSQTANSVASSLVKVKS